MNPVRARILVVEDEAAMARSLVENLRVEGYAAEAVGDGAAALDRLAAAAAAGTPWDLVLLDVMLPLLDGWEVLRRLRRRGDRTPVLMLTALGGQSERVRGLDGGADDYLPKPFALEELLARVRALLRRCPPHRTPERLELGTARIDLVARRIRSADGEMPLTPAEAAILGHLAAAAGAPVSREELIDCCLPEGERATNRTIDMHVRRLRTKLEVDPAAPRYLVTVFGEGYRLGG